MAKVPLISIVCVCITQLIELQNKWFFNDSWFTMYDLQLFHQQGMILAHTIKYSVETVLNLHTALGRPMGKACALSICSLMESLKAIENTYHRHNTLLAESLPHVMQYLTCQILSIIAAAKVRIIMGLFINISILVIRINYISRFPFLKGFDYSNE